MNSTYPCDKFSMRNSPEPFKKFAGVRFALRSIVPIAVRISVRIYWTVLALLDTKGSGAG